MIPNVWLSNETLTDMLKHWKHSQPETKFYPLKHTLLASSTENTETFWKKWKNEKPPKLNVVGCNFNLKLNEPFKWDAGLHLNSTDYGVRHRFCQFDFKKLQKVCSAATCRMLRNAAIFDFNFNFVDNVLNFFFEKILTFLENKF